ncbi:DUF7660 family protein [Nocardia alni]|uniref:DUF7660 family protein n=1 Tax=Nocardia alni TaxID=2815723 RepID=UPI001C21810F|nr:hypothetical protein [Nocardia alni]
MAELEPAEVHDRSEFVVYVHRLAEAVSHSPGDYENIRSGDFLEAAAAWVNDADDFIHSAESEERSERINWPFIATLLTAALVYE